VINPKLTSQDMHVDTSASSTHPTEYVVLLMYTFKERKGKKEVRKEMTNDDGTIVTE